MPLALIVGPGRAGTAMALALRAAGHEVSAAKGGPAARARYRELLDADVLPDVPQSPRPDLVVLSVPDGAIADVAKDLAQRGVFAQGQLVLHLSGALGSDVLAPAAERGAELLALHPLRSISDPRVAADQFAETIFTLEGQKSAIARGLALVRALRGTPWVVDPEQKARIHAAAVLASNALLALLFTAMEAAQPSEGDLAERAMLSLAEGALSNAQREGPGGALTGPVSRGDTETIRRHLRLLKGSPLVVYRAMLGPLAELARAEGRISRETAQEIRGLAEEVQPGWPSA